MKYLKKYSVHSERSGQRIVSLCDDGTYACDCIGWTRHFPRRDCKHIRWVREHNPAPLNQTDWNSQNNQKRAASQAIKTLVNSKSFFTEVSQE